MVREGLKMVREGSNMVREGLKMVREGLNMVREGSNPVRHSIDTDYSSFSKRLTITFFPMWSNIGPAHKTLVSSCLGALVAKIQ